MVSKVEKLCEQHGLKMTGQRRVIARVLSEAEDHPDVEEIVARANIYDKNISLATAYRTVRLLEQEGIVAKHEFGDGRARYEVAEDDHHDHLLDIRSGQVIEFFDKELEAIQDRIAKRLGYKLVGHRLELYGVPITDEE